MNSTTKVVDRLDHLASGHCTCTPHGPDVPPCARCTAATTLEMVAETLSSSYSYDHPMWWPAKCPRCGWEGMSNELVGGGPNPATDEPDDVVCPRCLEQGRLAHMSEASSYEQSESVDP